MDDLPISKASPAVKFFNRDQSFHTRQHQHHDYTPASPIPKQSITINTSTPLRGRKLANRSYERASPSSGSKFNFQFWTGKAKDVYRNVNKKNISSSFSSPIQHQHAITTAIVEETSGPNTMRNGADHPIFDRMVHQRYNPLPSDPVRMSPTATTSTPLPSALRDGTHSSPTSIILHRRKNSTSPAPFVRYTPEGIALRNPRLSETHSASSSEGPNSPHTPNGTPRSPLESFLKDKKQPCLRCHREVPNNVDSVRVSGGVYHTHCFSCHTCRKKLHPYQRLLECEGRVYCETDYNIMVKQQPLCAACGEPIGSHVRPTRALGKLYHPEHLRCYRCSKPVDPEMTGLVEYKNRIFCRTDFNAMYLPKCRACGRAVEKEAVSSADGKLLGQWHKQCFNCQACHEPFPSNTFYVYNNAPYCRRDYHKMNNSLCKGCDEPVEGRCAQTSEGWRFHPQCFKCSLCNSYITDVYYMSENRIFCANDRQHQSEKRHTLFENYPIVNI